LLLGFLSAVAILAPVYLIYFLIGVEAERAKTFASLPFGLFFVAFGQFAIYRARRYRLHRTVWRGLRFGMDGSGLAYSARAMGWGLLTLLSLGAAWPWAQAALERYKMKHTFYGDLQGSFVGKGGELFKRAWWIWATGVGAVVTLALVAAMKSREIHVKGAETSRVLTNNDGAATLIVTLIVLVGVFLAPTLYAIFKSIQWKWWLEGLRIGKARPVSSLKSSSLIGNYWKSIGWSFWVFLFGFAVLALIGGLAHRSQGPSLPAVVLSTIAYLMILLAIGVIWRIYFLQRVWKIVVSSLTLHNLESAQDLSLRLETTRPTALGEGFADSLDVVGF
jgi:uncharacterized membrane protein YjgN (DUF898 family)